MTAKHNGTQKSSIQESVSIKDRVRKINSSEAGKYKGRENFAKSRLTSPKTLLIVVMAMTLALMLVVNVSSVMAISTQTFTAVADARTYESAPTTNYGTSTYLQADGDVGIRLNTYISFSISGLIDPINSAKLRVFDTTNATVNGPAAYLAGNNWIESGSGGITWDTQPGLLSGAFDNKDVISTASWVEYDVTALISGNGTYTFALLADSTDGVTFSSREGANSPQLVLTLGTGTTSTATPLATLVPTQTVGATNAPTNTSTATTAPTPTSGPTTMPTIGLSATLVPTQTSGPTRTPTQALTSTPTATRTPKHGSQATSTPTRTASPTRTPTQVVIVTSTPTATKTTTPITSSTPNTSGIQHVFVVVMENHSYNEVWNTSSSPYITSLGNSFARATNYHATTHPSLPNYLDLYGGSNYGITTDCNPSSSCHINATNLADNLDAKGLTWKGYMESMPSPCYLTTSGSYAPRHNPMVYFDDIYTNATRCKAHDVPYTALATDLTSAATTPNYSLIVPNLCNDMHDCSVGTGDTRLKNNLPAILNSPACTVDKCLLILTWDEDDSSQSNQVLTIFAGSGAKTGGVTSGVSYTHFSLLRTIENIFGLPTQTSNDAAASPMNDLLR
jgi:hypothetical protein